MEKQPAPGLFGAGRGVLATLVDIVRTRVQLVRTELEEERLHLAELLLYATAALFLLGIGVILATLLLVLLFWDSHGRLVLGLLAAAYLAGGAGMVVAWRRKARRKPALLATTLAELSRDCDALRGDAAGPP